MWLLYPFSVLYSCVTSIRNWLFYNKILKEFQFSVATINVGNITVGGTGKSPHVEYLISLLHQQYQVATLSRGYGRKTKGFLEVNEFSNATMVGDEPLQFYKKFRQIAKVFVGEERLLAIPLILSDYPETNVILLDDAYQHRYVKPHINILLSDYRRPFYTDFVLPMGRLREQRKGAQRADIVVVSKSPEHISITEKSAIQSEIRKYNKHASIFFSYLEYEEIVSFGKIIENEFSEVILLTGIANAASFVQFISEKYNIVHHANYNDHHDYSLNDLKYIAELSQTHKNSVIITTEKDYVKLSDVKFASIIKELAIGYVPIKVDFKEETAKFNEAILNRLSLIN